MKFKDIIKKANDIKRKYASQNKKLGRKKWHAQDYYQGFVGDVGITTNSRNAMKD